MPLLLYLLLQVRAFALYSKARAGASNVTADDAVRQVQQGRRTAVVGRGGLGEAAEAEAAAGGSSIGRGDAADEVEEEDGHHLLLQGAGKRDEAVATTSE